MAAYRNVLQYGDQAFEWDPSQQVFSGGMQENAPAYLTELLGYRDRLRAGQTMPWEAEQYAQWEQQARAIPTRDIASLTSGWQGDLQGQWTDSGWQAGAQDWWTQLDPGSPDSGPIMLAIRDKMDAGIATPQERALYGQTLAMAQDWNWRASTPQASDANPFGMGDQFMMALAALTAAAGGAGSFGAFGAAGAAGAAGAGAGAASTAPSLLGVPLSTLSTIGQLGTYGGMGANVLGSATDQDWLTQLGLGLGVTGGLAGGLAGLGSVFNSGVSSLTDAARLASSAGRITGAVGRASGVAPLQQAAGYLGQAGQVGSLGAGVLPESVTDWSTQRGGGPMSEWDYSWDYGGEQPYDNWSYAGGSPTFDESGGGNFFNSPAYQQFTGWGGDERQTGWYQNADLDTSGGGSLWGTLGSLGSSALGFLGRNASWLSPALSSLGGIASGALGSNASSNAAAAQSAAANRALDLSTAQWLTQQQQLAPWMQAGQEALGHMTGRMAWQGPQQVGATPAISGANYALPSATPGWNPQAYQGPAGVDANAYRYTPGQVPSAAQYRYQPGQIPNAGQFRYTPGAVPTLQGAELLANDPGYQWRQDEARRALEASALARGSGMSGSTLAALQRQSSDLASNEYANAWQRVSQQAQMREGWAQQASQMGFGQAMSEAQFREQAAQIASQQGFSQAQAEAALREQLAQQSSQQGFSQALAAQGQQWQQGFAGQQWTQKQQQDYANQLYQNLFQQSQTQYGRDVYSNEADYQRQQQAYQQQIAELQRQWGQFAQVAGMGQGATNQFGAGGQANAQQQASLLGQLGNAQAGGSLGASQAWLSSLGNLNNSLQGTLQNQSLLQALSQLNR